MTPIVADVFLLSTPMPGVPESTSKLPRSPETKAENPVSPSLREAKASESVRSWPARVRIGTSASVEYAIGPSIMPSTNCAKIPCTTVVGCTPSAKRYVVAAFAATRFVGPQNCELMVVAVVIGGNGPHAMPVVLVMPKAAALLRSSVKNVKESIGITRMPAEARPENSVVL